MKTYTVFWHYCSNHGAYLREAESAEAACRSVAIGFSPDFRRKAVLIAIEGGHRMKPAVDYLNRDDIAALEREEAHNA